MKIKSLFIKIFLKIVMLYSSFYFSKIKKYFDKNGLTKKMQYEKKGIKARYLQLYMIHKLIKEKELTTVIEFGSGWTTLIAIDSLIKNNEKCQLIVFEHDKKWLNETKKIIPKSYLKKIRFINEKPNLVNFNNMYCLEYKKLPNISPDLIIVDGPNTNDFYGKINGLTTEKVIYTNAIKNIVDYSYSVPYFLFDHRFDCVKLLYQKSIKNHIFNYYYISKQFFIERETTITKPYINSRLSHFFFSSLFLKKFLQNKHRVNYYFFKRF